MHGVIVLIKEGNPFMIFNVMVFLFSLAVIAERFWHVFFRLNISDKAFLEEVQKKLESGNVENAIKLCALRPQAPLAIVTRAALAQVRFGSEAISAAIDESLLEVVPVVKKRIEMLWSIANVATLVGLIGTISGLISAFQAVAAVDPEKKTAILTAGISEAMYNTAFGLTIAVSCIVAHMVLHNQTKKIAAGVEVGGVKVENILNRLRAQQQLREKAAKP